jgi:hypothetical protein
LQSAGVFDIADRFHCSSFIECILAALGKFKRGTFGAAPEVKRIDRAVYLAGNAEKAKCRELR